VASGFIGENGELLSEVRGQQLQKRVVIDVYQGGDTSTYLITSMLKEDETGFGITGSTDYVRNTVSLGEIMPRETIIKFTLEKQYKSGLDALTAENPRTRGAAKMFVLDTVEQIIADKIAHGEPVTDAESAIDHNRRVRDSRTRSYLMGSAVSDPIELADIDIEALLHSSDPQ